MPIIECIDIIFPSQSAPYSMPEIISRLQLMYSENLTRSAIYRAHVELRKSEATAPLVKPLDPYARELQYSERAARRIARKVISNRLPAQIHAKGIQSQKIIAPTTPPIQQIETRVGLDRDEGGIYRFSFT